MNYNLYLKYEVDLDLNINDESGTLCNSLFASVMHETEEAVSNAVNDEPERTKIGFVYFLQYNQALAMTYGVNMTQEKCLTMRRDSKALMELDYTLITPQTLAEIGPSTNPNIMVLQHFGIAAAWRNKGMGEQALKGIIKQMKGKCGYVIILNCRPEQCEHPADPVSFYARQGVELAGLEKDPEKAQWKLNAFFQKCGFKLFKDYDNVFVCNVEQTVAERRLVASF